MAETLLGVVVEGVLTKAFSLAGELISGVWGVKEDLQRLAEQLEMIQALLSDAESKATISRAVELWLKRLVGAATDADHLLDEFAYEVLRKKIEKQNLNKVRNFFSPSIPLAFRVKMASKIKKINSRLDGIFQESKNIGLEIINSYNIDLRRDRITVPFVDDSEIVGRNDGVDKVVSELTSLSDKDLSVIGIVGMAGQGNTALAQLIYKKIEKTGYFEKKIWVCVSDESKKFNVENILKDMLQSLTKKVSMLTMGDVIVSKLKEELNGKRFLLVLDDVWNEDAECWSCMKNCLQEIGGSKGSKIIVTTRSERVVSIMRASLIHRLRVLSEQDSWKLFEKIAFAEGGAVKTPGLVNIGKKIVKRCGGLPLAIKALGRLLYSKRDASEWLKIEESNIWGSLDAPTGVMSIIKLSYDHLSSLSLKQCFAYCSIFEKDDVMERKNLIELWMANGLLNPSRGSNLEMEDVGNDYFNILLQRSLFQDTEIDDYGNIESCKMHDLVHDFALEASKDRCLTVGREGGLQTEDIKAVHLSIISNGSESLNISTKNFFKLKTLFLSGPICFDNLLMKCKYLCVLVLSDALLEVFPKSIVKLRHLRHLDISHTSIATLPNSKTKLYNLQTLKVYELRQLPACFGNLVKLRHFIIEKALIKFIVEKKVRHFFLKNEEKTLLPGIRKLTSLRTLPFFVVSPDKGCQIEELGYLQNLEGNLRIYGLENLELSWGDGIGQECNYDDVLEGLKPHSNLKGLRISGFAGENLPSWLMNISHELLLHNLVSIELVKFNGCRQIPPLGHLPYLKVVKVWEMEIVKCIGNELYGWVNQSAPTNSTGAFSSLKEFRLSTMSNLEQWSDPAEHSSYKSNQVLFPLLEILQLCRVPKLTHLPHFLSTIFSLRDLFICECDSLVSIPSIQHLQSLEELGIIKCHKLGGLPDGLETCTKLKGLCIDDCPSIQLEDLCCPPNLRELSLCLTSDVDYDCFPWPRKFTTIPPLETLILRRASKIKSLPEQIQHLPALRKLIIEDFDGVEALPEWLCDTHSLQYVRVSRWRNLAYLPSREALQRRTYVLGFYGCPILEERCKEGSGPKWDKIADITNIKWFH